MAVKVAKKGDEGKVGSALARLIEEDPAIRFVVDPETKQQIISGLGTQHLEVALAKLKNKFGVEITLENPRVPYRESIRKSCKAQGRHKKQTGGHGQFGDVWIQFEPIEGEGIEFAENVFGGSVPKNFFPAVEKGVRQAAEHGVLAGYPMVGMKPRCWTAVTTLLIPAKWRSLWPPNSRIRPPSPRPAPSCLSPSAH